MLKRGRPGIDRAIEPQFGVSREGQPLSYNRAPAPDLVPWIAGLYATIVDAPPDYRLDCGLFNDTTLMRLQLKGDWTAHTADGVRQHARSALFFGPQTRLMPISVQGAFASTGISFRPGAGFALSRARIGEHTDRFVTCEQLGFPGEAALAMLEAGASPEDWLSSLEDLLRELIARTKANLPDPVSTRFEAIAFAKPSQPIADIARDIGIEQRQLERIVRRDFGMAPKKVLRRARALDMASHLRGVADDAEAEELALRYFDQSHLIHEFTDLFGMTPKRFVETPLPILTLALESRQARRLEALKRLAPGAKRPWEQEFELSRTAN
ncbi:MAG: AraC family transcriptional regulator [Novosphingobium sp.]